MTDLECIPTEDERKEIVQDVIDRLMYLSNRNRELFLSRLGNLFVEFDLDIQAIDGIRIYKKAR
jgi:hypothetical protein